MSVLQGLGKPPLAGGVGEACYIKAFLSEQVGYQKRAEKLAGSEPGRRKCVEAACSDI